MPTPITLVPCCPRPVPRMRQSWLSETSSQEGNQLARDRLALRIVLTQRPAGRSQFHNQDLCAI